MMTCTDAALLSIRDISGSSLSQSYQRALERASWYNLSLHVTDDKVVDSDQDKREYAAIITPYCYNSADPSEVNNSITPIIISENKKQIYSSISNGPKTQQQGIKKGHLYQPVDFSMRLPKTIF